MSRKPITEMSLMASDVLRLVVDFVAYAITLSPAAAAFVFMWRTGETVYQILAFPAAYVGMVIGFWVSVVLLRVAFLRKIEPGEYHVKDPKALRWILSDSLMRLIQRSFLRGYIDDFAPMRYFFYRLLGAKVDKTFFFGWEARILDPWGLEVGRNSIIGSFTVVTAHAVEGDRVILRPVKIGNEVLIGGNCVILPGVEVGDRAIIGACSLVLKDTVIPAGEIWAGAPAKRIGTRQD